MGRWVAVGMLALAGWGLWAGSGVAQDDVALPQRMGAINDYAASLGTQTREGLQTQIERLNEEADVDLAVLITLIDPFGDPVRYAEAIWNDWEMGSERTVLLVYAREAEARWAFRVRASSDLSNQLGGLRSGGEARGAIDNALADRDVAEAVRLGVNALAEQWVPDTPDRPSESDDTTTAPSDESAASSAGPPSSTQDAPWWRSLWAWVGGGILAILAIVSFGIWAMLAWFCPRCGGRLEKRTETPRPWERAGRATAGRTIHYCPRCRYGRRTTKRRRTRGERRRAAGRRR